MDTKYQITCPKCKEHEGSFQKISDTPVVWSITGFLSDIVTVEYATGREADLLSLIEILKPKCICGYELQPEDGKV